jgi:hypothetical protein
MKAPGACFISKQVITYEFTAVAAIISLIWLDEIIDIPHLLLGAESTPLNWRESLFESIIIALLGAVIINCTSKLFRKMKFLEGILPVCASCKKIRDDKGHWHQIESFIRERSDAEFSHSICPECAEKLYPEYNQHKKE